MLKLKYKKQKPKIINSINLCIASFLCCFSYAVFPNLNEFVLRLSSFSSTNLSCLC